MSRLKVETVLIVPAGPLIRLGDWLLRPVMRLLGGFQADSLQETHFWHGLRIDAGQLSDALMVRVRGDDARARVTHNRVWPFPSFHAPVLGGWRRYVVIEAREVTGHWHVGWIHRAWPDGSRPRCHANRLPLRDPRVRVLKQSPGFVTDFFGVDDRGRQVPLRIVDEGELGSGAHPHIRLL